MNYRYLKNKILKCSKCPGLNIPKETMSAAGYGSLNAELFVIGQSLHSYNSETPDRQIPFVGPSYRYDSGDILYDSLEKAGYSYDKKNLYVTNIVKCHPPGNRKSKEVEIMRCMPYLMNEIQIINPKIFLTLGNDVRDFFDLPKIKIGDYVDLKIKDAFVYVIAYHPSYVLRNRKSIGKYTRQFVETLNKAKKEIK